MAPSKVWISVSSKSLFRDWMLLYETLSNPLHYQLMTTQLNSSFLLSHATSIQQFEHEEWVLLLAVVNSEREKQPERTRILFHHCKPWWLGLLWTLKIFKVNATTTMGHLAKSIKVVPRGSAWDRQCLPLWQTISWISSTFQIPRYFTESPREPTPI